MVRHFVDAGEVRGPVEPGGGEPQSRPRVRGLQPPRFSLQISVRGRAQRRGRAPWSLTGPRRGRAQWRRRMETKGRRRHFVTCGAGGGGLGAHRAGPGLAGRGSGAFAGLRAGRREGPRGSRPRGSWQPTRTPGRAAFGFMAPFFFPPHVF